MMKLKVASIFIFTAVALFLGGVPLYNHHFRGRVMASPQAFTIYQHLVAGADTPNPATVETRVIAQRGDGSHVVAKHNSHLQHDDRDLINLPAGTEARVLDEVQAVSTFRIDTASYLKTWGTPRDSSTGCVRPLTGTSVDVSAVLETDTIQGVPVNKIQVQPNFFVWMAPGLNCQEMQHQISFTDAKPSTTMLYTDRVVWGEPDPSLFTVPTNYTEMKPSDAERARLLKMGNVPADVLQNMVANYQKRDPKYLANRP